MGTLRAKGLLADQLPKLGPRLSQPPTGSFLLRRLNDAGRRCWKFDQRTRSRISALSAPSTSTKRRGSAGLRLRSPDRLAGSAASRMFRRVSWRLSWYRSSVGACCRRRTAPRLIGAFSHSCQISPQSEGMAGMPSHSVKRGRRRLRELINYDNDLACEIGKFVQLDCDACTRRRRGFSLHPPPP